MSVRRRLAQRRVNRACVRVENETSLNVIAHDQIGDNHNGQGGTAEDQSEDTESGAVGHGSTSIYFVGFGRSRGVRPANPEGFATLKIFLAVAFHDIAAAPWRRGSSFAAPAFQAGLRRSRFGEPITASFSTPWDLLTVGQPGKFRFAAGLRLKGRLDKGSR